MKVFIDTSAFVALLVDKETDHKKVAEKYHEYRQKRAILFTSDYILDELFTRLLYFRHIDIKKYIEKLKESILRGEITVLQIDEANLEKALKAFLKFSDHKISFTDATSYTLFKDFSLDEVFTLDDDFKKIRVVHPSKSVELTGLEPVTSSV
ncbi:type II toxin-antitoxin system VapC family toxin [Candidatus Daviesbacteria bacterium]|nr:type II toxin-antitoxin system VapC family toxin [Candidatus Daviesbacteria bacterium]